MKDIIIIKSAGLRETTGCMSILYLVPKKFLQTKTKWMWNTNELPDDVFSMFNITVMKIEFLQRKQLLNEILWKLNCVRTIN